MTVGRRLIDRNVLNTKSVVWCIAMKENDLAEIGIEKNPFPKGWKGETGLYAVGFTRRGLSGASLDAISVAHDIANAWKQETKQQIKSVAASHRRCISHF